VLNIIVQPSILTSIKLITDLSTPFSADSPVSFQVIPYDTYLNVANAAPKDINLSFLG